MPAMGKPVPCQVVRELEPLPADLALVPTLSARWGARCIMMPAPVLSEAMGPGKAAWAEGALMRGQGHRWGWRLWHRGASGGWGCGRLCLHSPVWEGKRERRGSGQE